MDADIRNFKGNSVKETIKRGLEEMAEHKLQIGDIQGALKYFSKSRDYCLQAHHERSMCLNIIKTASEFLYTLEHSRNLDIDKGVSADSLADKTCILVIPSF